MTRREDAAEPAPAEVAEEESPLELCLSAGSPPPEPARVDGVAIGVLSGFTSAGEPLVALPWHPQGSAGIVGRAAAALSRDDEGADVAVVFEGGQPARPIVIGKLHVLREPEAIPDAEPAAELPIELEADGERVVVSSARELVLRCGKASITLTRAGKILIRGEYVLTRSSGTNRILGGSVQIN